jgi:hypothetical protein
VTQVSVPSTRRWSVAVPAYDRYYTNGFNVGRESCLVPTVGLAWGHVHDPVDTSFVLPAPPAPSDAPFTGILNWQSHETIEYQGTQYGQKDAEFPPFRDLPGRTDAALELAVAGVDAPCAELARWGWRVANPHAVTLSLGSFLDYVAASLGEIAVCKNVFVALRTGCFSDRSAVYLARSRPVVMQHRFLGTSSNR